MQPHVRRQCPPAMEMCDLLRKCMISQNKTIHLTSLRLEGGAPARHMSASDIRRQQKCMIFV